MIYQISNIFSQSPLAKIWSKKPLSSFLNILSLSFDRRLRRCKVKGFPFFVYYEPTMFCNLRCPSCPTGTGILDRPKVRVEVDTFENIVGSLSKNIFELIMYNWGEPFLHKELADLVRYATNKGIAVFVSSNLSVPLNQEQCEALVNSGLYSLKVGIDGASKATHAMYRRGSDLDVVHANLANLVAAKNKLSSPTPIISVSYLMFAHNEDEFSKFQRQMADLGVDNWYAAPAWLPKGGSINPPKDPRYDMYLLTNDLISKFRSQGGALRPCSWLYYATVINPNGTISPCCGVLSEKSDFGKLDCKEAIVNQFYTDWNGDLYQKARGLFINSDEVKHWAETNLKDLSPDGMALSQKGVSMICAQCPIPHTISIWGEDLKTLFFAFLRETLRCGVSLDYRGFITNIIRTSILCLALCFNAM